MKTTLTTIAALMIGTAAMAGGLGAPIAEAPATSSTFTDATPRFAYCTNAPGPNGSVGGLMLEGVGFIYEAASADRATTRVAGILPAGLSAHDAQDAVNGLAAIGYTNVTLFTRPDRDDKIVQGTETVIDTSVETVIDTSVKPRLASDGQTYETNNTTSMGNAASNGAPVLRVQAATAQTVTIRFAGSHESLTVEVPAGRSYVDLPRGGTTITTFEGGQRVTKALGHQPFNDVVTTEREVITETPREVPVDVVVRTSSPERWCRGPRM